MRLIIDINLEKLDGENLCDSSVVIPLLEKYIRRLKEQDDKENLFLTVYDINGNKVGSSKVIGG